MHLIVATPVLKVSGQWADKYLHEVPCQLHQGLGLVEDGVLELLWRKD